MKQFIFFLSIVCLLFGCSYDQSKYPNIKTEQIFSQLPWGLDYKTVHKILTEEYKLEFVEEQPHYAPNKMYLYNGGRYNNINTKDWIVNFYNDSLVYVHLRVSDDSPKGREWFYNELCKINDKEFLRDSALTNDQDRWYYEKDGKRKGDIVLAGYKLSPSTAKGFSILITKK